MSMTNATLKAAVAGYIHRTDLTTQIPDFIDQARLRIGADLRGLANFTTATVTSFLNGLTALPTNLAQLVSVSDANGVPLQPITLDQVQLFTSGVYAVAGTDLYVPDAGTATVVQLVYYAIPAPLVNAGDVSESMVEFPNLWLYASVAEAALYIQDYELADRFGAAYKAMIEDTNRAGYQARFAAPSIQSDQPMIQTQSSL